MPGAKPLERAVVGRGGLSGGSGVVSFALLRKQPDLTSRRGCRKRVPGRLGRPGVQSLLPENSLEADGPRWPLRLDAVLRQLEPGRTESRLLSLEPPAFPAEDVLREQPDANEQGC